jgi:hypothetical protein
MIPLHLLESFYTTMSEHELATEYSRVNYDVVEYDESMLAIRKAIRFFADYKQRNEDI